VRPPSVHSVWVPLRGVGRSRAVFLIPNVPSPAVIQAIANFAAREKLRPRASPAPNQLILSRGSEAIAGMAMIIILVWDVPGGCSVSVEAWVETMLGDQNADKNAINDMFARRRLWKTLGRLCDDLGAPGARAMFQHA